MKDVDASLPYSITASYLKSKRIAEDMFRDLTYLAGDVDRYLQNLDNKNKKQAAQELLNMRARLKELKDNY